MSMKNWLIGLALVLSSCAYPKVEWEGTTDWTAEERAEIEAGRDFICQQTGHVCESIEWVRPPGDGGDRVVVKMPPSHDAETFSGSKLRIELAATNTLRRAAAHAFAHTRGMRHLAEGESGLMSGDRFTTNDLAWSDADELECVAVKCRGARGGR